MADRGTGPTREERLAQQLRANLRRRKAQARGLAKPGPGGAAVDPPAVPLPKPDSDG